MMWTIVPAEALFDEGDESGSVAEMSAEGATVVWRRGSDGRRRVERLLSTNPKHYLRPEWQPGVVWPGKGEGP